ncbi:MAG: hypothetical protein U0105_05950 [Candidatus Obscuribacterales bacterium]
MSDQTVEDKVKKTDDQVPPSGDDQANAPGDVPPAPKQEDAAAAMKAMFGLASEYFASLDNPFKAGGSKSAESPKEFKHPGQNGGTWTKGEDGSWQYQDAAGKVQDKFGGQVKDLTMKDGVLTVSLADGRVVKAQKDGSSLEYTNDKLTKINYADGRERRLEWDGDSLRRVTSTKGEWFERQKNSQGEYVDRWKAEKSGQTWNGKISTDKETGDYSLESTDDKTKGPVTYMRDGAEKTEARDGSYTIKYPSGASESFNKNGTMTGMTGADKVRREFGYETVDGKETLTSVKLTDETGKTNVWKNEKGTWTYNGEPTKFTFNVDSKNKTYSFTDPENDKTTTVTATGKESKFGDGTQVVVGSNGEVKSATKGDVTFEYVRDKNGVTEVRETKNGEPGRTWKKNSEGKWTDGSKVIEGGLTVTDRGEPSFGDKSRQQVFKLDGRSVESVKNADGSTVESSDGRTKITAADGSTREVYSKKDENGRDVIYKEETVRDGKRQTWERQTRPTSDGGVEYTNEWKNTATGEVENRKSVTVSDKGEFSVEYEDGTKYTARTNGTERRENAAQKWNMELENGKPTTINFGDGTSRTYKWKGDTVEQMVVTPPGEKPITWSRVGDKKYKTSSGSTTNGTIEVDSKGKYVFNDFDDKTITTRLPDGKLFSKDTTSGVESEKVGGKVVAMRKDGSEFKLNRDEKGNVNEVQDSKTNTTWKKQADGTWQAAALDDKKPWQKPDDIQRKGDVVVDEKKGTVSFLGADGSLLRHSMTGIEKVSRGTELEKKVVDDKRLTDQEKIRFLENLDRFSKRTDLDDKQKEETLKNIERTLDAADNKDGYFDATERAKLAEQMAWHVANPTLDAQGQRPNCNVTDIRIAMLHQNPADWTRMTADMITKGYFKTADGTQIFPKDKQSFRPSDAEKTFPPADGDRSWLGKISDVTMLDIHWQRRTTDSFGNSVAKNSMTYEEIKPTDADDSGGRIFQYYQSNGQWYRSEQKRAPNVYGKDIMDIYGQITGKDESNRYLINGDQNHKGPGVTSVGSAAELEAALSKGPWPKIIQVQNDVLYKQKNDGKDHCHVVVITGVKDGKALIDNSHGSKWDRLQDGIPIAHLYEATKRQGTAKYEAIDDKTTQGSTTVNNNQIRYQQTVSNNQNGYWQNGVYYTYVNNNNGNYNYNTNNNYNNGWGRRR